MVMCGPIFFSFFNTLSNSKFHFSINGFKKILRFLCYVKKYVGIAEFLSIKCFAILSSKKQFESESEPNVV